MKKYILLLVVLLIAGVASAQVLTLNSAETLSVPTATKLDLNLIQIDAEKQTIGVRYRFMDAGGHYISEAGNPEIFRWWYCTDRAPELAANCTELHNPYWGCTGVGTGENLDPGTTCFTDTFRFAVREQDVGTPIGKGLRALIWNKMKKSVLTGTNDATLP